METITKMSLFLAVILAVFFQGSRAEQPIMTVTENIEYWGYPAEEHQVTTEDGYILTMHRIPGTATDGRPPVFFGHCLLCTSGIWTFGPPERELAYMLADQGYDIWFGNNRGNTWSKNHETLPAEDPEFWAFEWHQAGTLDYPAELDYVLATTGADDLFFVGYSQGTTQYFVLLSELPEYNDKIRAGFMLAPATFMGNGFAQILELSEQAEELAQLFHEQLGIYEFLPHHDIFSTIGHELCDDDSPVTENICVDIFGLMMPPELVNASMISFYLDHLPGGSSLEMLVHYAQNYLTPGEFNKYNFGEEGNMEHYGQATPPAYDLSQVTALTALFVGDGDGLATVADNDILASVLPNLHSYEVVDYPGYNHLAFAFATNAGELYHSKIVQYMEELL